MKRLLVIVCLTAAAGAFAKDLRCTCNSPYELRYAGNLHDLVAVVPDGGEKDGALKLTCPAKLPSALFHGWDKIEIEDMAAPIRLTMWVKGDAHGGITLLTYDARHRNVYVGGPSAKYEVKASDGWKKLVAEYAPEAGSEFCRQVKFLLPAITCSSGESVLVDGFSVEFLPRPDGLAAWVGGNKDGSGSVKSDGDVASPRNKDGSGSVKSDGDVASPCVPTVKKAPPFAGAFRWEDWKAAVRLGDFATFKDAAKAAPESTDVLLCRDAKTLYAALVMDGADVPALAARREKDLVKAPWALDGVECVFGRDGSFLHVAFDYMGRYYSNGDVKLFVSTDYAATRVVVRFALPLEAVPRENASDLVTRMNFYRKQGASVSCWKPNASGRFNDPKQLHGVYLDSAEAVAADIRRQADARAALIARGEKLKAKYGVVGEKVEKVGGGGQRIVDPETAERFWSKVEPLWKPPKIFGRDYWNAIVTMGGTYDRFRRAGVADDPFIREALLWLWWENNTAQFLDPNGWAQKVLREHPESAMSVKGMDRMFLDAKTRERPDIKAYWDKDYAEKFLSIYDGDNGRFLGFWEDEAFVCDTGFFAVYLEKFGMPKPKNREEAYADFKFFYSKHYDTIPEVIPFRNVANASPYFYKYACNSAAATFNHFTSAFGDMMSGNETGDCMGSNPPKFAIARGAARQWGRPWRNYQTYYQWVFLESKGSGGLRCQYDNGNLLKPDCRYYMYGFCNGPDQGTDEARQKNTFLYPYFCGCGVYSSEANHEEMMQWYDDEEIKTADPMCVALRDAKALWLSPLAKINRHFYDEIVKKRDRGVTLTPIGVVFDRASGYATLYFGNAVWDFFAPTEMEQTMWAFNNHVFKAYEKNHYYATSEFGDVFDTITNDASEDFLKTYPVLMPIGDVTLDRTFAAKVRKYVEAGGTFVINAALALKYPDAFDEAFLGAKIGETPAKSVGTYSRLSGRQIIEETAYRYRPLTPNEGTGILAVTADTEAPVIVMSRVGKGRVILTAPDNMKPKGSNDAMLKLFDDLVASLRAEALPIRVEADRDVEYALARNGTSYLVYFNNNNGIPPNHGIYKTPPKTDVTKRAGAKVSIPRSMGKVKRVIDWWTGAEIPFSADSCPSGRGASPRQTEPCTTASFTLPGGDCAVLEFVLAE